MGWPHHQQEQRWRAACEKAVREKEALLEGAGAGGAAAADTALASQWRKRCVGAWSPLIG